MEQDNKTHRFLLPSLILVVLIGAAGVYFYFNGFSSLINKINPAPTAPPSVTKSFADLSPSQQLDSIHAQNSSITLTPTTKKEMKSIDLPLVISNLLKDASDIKAYTTIYPTSTGFDVDFNLSHDVPDAFHDIIKMYDHKVWVVKSGIFADKAAQIMLEGKDYSVSMEFLQGEPGVSNVGMVVTKH